MLKLRPLTWSMVPSVAAALVFTIAGGVLTSLVVHPTKPTQRDLFTGSLIPLTKIPPPTWDGNAIVFDITVAAVSIDGNVNYPVVATQNGKPVSDALEEIQINGVKVEFDKAAQQVALRLTFTTTVKSAKIRFIPKRGSTTTAILIHSNTSSNPYVEDVIQKP